MLPASAPRAGVRPMLVIVEPPGLDHAPCLWQAGEPALVEALVA
jgi:hypothetical protein